VFVVVNGSSEQKEKEKAKEADTYMIWSGELDATIGTKDSLVWMFHIVPVSIVILVSLLIDSADPRIGALLSSPNA
jgi:hypothetical protein